MSDIVYISAAVCSGSRLGRLLMLSICFRLIPEEVLQSNRVAECLRPLDKKLGLALVVKKMDELNCRHPIFRNKQLRSKIYRSSFYMKPELG